MNGPIEVRVVSSWMDRRRFLHLPWSIYKGDKYWVPPTLMVERQLAGMGSHAFYQTARVRNLLALRGGKPVGRVSAIVNQAYNIKNKDTLGFFGFFECVDDVEVARALFDAGGDWLRGQGMTAVRGPANPSLNYTCGMLVDGFNDRPVIQMTYNPRYYGALVEASGFEKSHDLYAYEMHPDQLLKAIGRYRPAVLSRLEQSDLTLRQFRPNDFQRDLETYLDIYNQSLDGTWGFSPLSLAEARHIASELKMLIEPEFSVFAEINGKPIGGVLALLDYNKIFAKLNGRVFPFGYRLFTQRKTIDTARAMALTMIPGYQNSGLGVVLLDDLMRPSAKRGITRWEFSWILESNGKSRGSLERAGIPISKTYRMYDKAL